MKKLLALFLIVVLCLSLSACSVTLTDKQTDVCSQADELIDSLAELVGNSVAESEVKKIDGELIYIATIDYQCEVDQSNAITFQDYVLPSLEKTLHAEDIYVVLYLNEFGEEKYRLIDSELNPEILD